MNIDELTDQEKSALLARAMGFKTQPSYQGSKVLSFQFPGSEVGHTNLYLVANMALAWRVLNWASNQLKKETAIPGHITYTWAGRLHSFWGASYWVDAGKLFLYSMEPADAQRLWLDKILELAIKDGLIEEVPA